MKATVENRERKNFPEKITPHELPWFKQWFDSAHYHHLYGNRNDEEARQFIERLVHLLEPAPAARMVDIGCGAGRHSRYLASMGYNVKGFDLSANSIFEAKKSEAMNLQFRRHDMREPFGKNNFDYAFNFFTSFGYFKKGTENLKVVKNMADALKTGGTLVIDYMNASYTARELMKSEEKNIDGVIYHIHRWFDGEFFYKKIVIEESVDAKPFEFTERVAAFTVADFKEMFAACRLQIKESFGNYQLSPFNPEKSPRLILVAEKMRGTSPH
jgi:SAM-dependent methyltransferase